MDNLIEALKTGSAFNVNRERKDPKKRTPRVAGGKYLNTHCVFGLVFEDSTFALCEEDLEELTAVVSDSNWISFVEIAVKMWVTEQYLSENKENDVCKQLHVKIATREKKAVIVP